MLKFMMIMSVLFLGACNSLFEVNDYNERRGEFCQENLDKCSLAKNEQFCTYSENLNTLACVEQTYKTVVLGNQIWMAENLNYGSYVESNVAEPGLLGAGQKYCSENNPENCKKLGGLYQWHTAMGLDSNCASGLCGDSISGENHQGVCPFGWHIPSSGDWLALVNSQGGSEEAGKVLKDVSLNGNNSSSFSVLGAGSRYPEGNFRGEGPYAYFWEMSEDDGVSGSYKFFDSGSNLVNSNTTSKKYGYSVRCIKD